MKAKIVITGGIGGNSVILKKLRNYTDWKKFHFGGYIVEYSSVFKAKQDLKDAYNSIIDEYHPDPAPVSIGKSKDRLDYDASTAKIEY